MEGFPILLIIAMVWIVFVSLMSAAKKQAGQQQKNRGRPAAPPPPQEPKATVSPQEDPAARSVMVPTVTVSSHDDSVYMGSLNAVTGEGFDPCHEEQMSSLGSAEKTLPPPSAEQARLPFGWTGDDVVRGIVVSEILKRKT